MSTLNQAQEKAEVDRQIEEQIKENEDFFFPVKKEQETMN